MRVEKTGEGDNDGPACTDRQATAELEAAAYVAGLAALRSYQFIDPEKIFVFAHSLGPLIGSLALPGQNIRGFTAAEIDAPVLVTCSRLATSVPSASNLAFQCREAGHFQPTQVPGYANAQF